MTDSNKTYQSGVRFRAHPDAALATTVRQWIGCQRVVYNAKNAEDRLFASQRRLELESGVENLVTPLDQQYSHFKNAQLTPWLSEVPSQILRNGAVRWMAAKQRQLKGLARAPRRRNRLNFDSVQVTGELFRFRVIVDSATGESRTVIELGTESRPVGILPFTAHRAYGLPKQIVLRERAHNEWFVSFSYEAQGETVLRAPHELAYELRNLAADEIVLRTTGLDRNVRDNCIATSDGRQYALEPVVLERIHRKEVGVRRHQKRLARCQKGSRNRRKLIKKIARKHAYGRDARDDFSHKVSYDLATSQALMFVLEKLHIKGLTKRPKTKQDPKTGKWLPNGRRSKAALNQKILYSCWGSIALKLNYKTARRNKLTVKVPAAYSSQECSRCGHTHPDNRKEDRFACQRCGLEAHADTNAALVIRKRGLKLLGEGAYEVAPKKKRVGLRRKNSGTTGGLPAHVCGADVRPEAAELPEQRKAIRNEAENAAP